MGSAYRRAATCRRAVRGLRRAPRGAHRRGGSRRAGAALQRDARARRGRAAADTPGPGPRGLRAQGSRPAGASLPARDRRPSERVSCRSRRRRLRSRARCGVARSCSRSLVGLVVAAAAIAFAAWSGGSSEERSQVTGWAAVWSPSTPNSGRDRPPDLGRQDAERDRRRRGRRVARRCGRAHAVRIDEESGDIETLSTGATPTDVAVGRGSGVGRERRAPAEQAQFIGPVPTSVARIDPRRERSGRASSCPSSRETSRISRTTISPRPTMRSGRSPPTSRSSASRPRPAR